jgi:WD40 repeat protein
MSNDGKLVLTGSDDGTAILWDAASGQLLRTFSGHSNSVRSVAMSADGKRILTGSEDTTAILWDAISGQQLRVFEGHDGWIASVALSGDARRVVTASDTGDAKVILWDAATGKMVRSFEGHFAAISGDGKRIVTASLAGAEGIATIWETDTGKQLRTFKGDAGLVFGNGVSGYMALSGDGKRLLTRSIEENGNSAIFWDTDSGRRLQTFRHAAKTVALSADGKHAATASVDNAVLWDTETGKQLQSFKEKDPASGVDGSIGSLALSGGGKRVVTGQWGHAILWDTESGKPIQHFKGRTSQVSTLAFSHDGKSILTGSGNAFDGFAVLWQIDSGKPFRYFLESAAAVESLAWSDDDKRIVMGCASGDTVLWDATSRQRLRTFKRDGNYLGSVAMNAAGTRVVRGCYDGKADLWETESGKRLRTFNRHSIQVNSVALSSDGRRVLTGCSDGTAVLSDAVNGNQLQVFKHSQNIWSVALRGDGKRALTGSADGTAILWDTASGEKLRTYKHDAAWVLRVAFSADGRRVLTGTNEGTALLWDADSGKQLKVFKGHGGRVDSVAFSPDGKRVLTGSSDGAARLWDSDSGEELCRLISLEGGADWLVVTPSGLFDGSAGGRLKVNYRVGGGLNVVPVDRFFQDFYRPGLLASIFKGEKPKLTTAFAGSKPPSVRITTPKEGGIVENRAVLLESEVTDEGGGIQGPWLFLNGARFPADATTNKIGTKIKRTFKVSLVEGDNRFEIKAATADGSWESEPAAITLRYEKPLDRPVMHVVAIGISKYAEGSFKLKFASADAKAVAQLFESRGKSLYRQVKVTSLVDEDASREKIRDALKSVPQQAQPQDTLVLFLAGHGVMVGQRYYFIPYDFRASKDKKLEDDIRQQGLPADELTDFIGAGTALKRIVILDTCASGGVVSLFKVGSRNPFAFRGEIEKLSRAQGICFLAASSATEEAKEPEALGHGVLTYTLLAGLKAVDGGPLEGKGLQPTGRNQVVEVVEWFSYANGHVGRLTKEYCGQEQNVQMSVQGQSFPVLPLK